MSLCEGFGNFSYWAKNTSVIHIWKNGCGSGFPSKNALSSTSDLSGWENGASWAAPLTVANDKMSPYTCVQPATWKLSEKVWLSSITELKCSENFQGLHALKVLTCLPSNQVLYDTVVLSPKFLANPFTSDLVPINGITESWSPLQ